MIATLRQVHPEMTADQIVALAKKQASDPANRGRLKPVEGHEYRGAGLPNALDAVLKDQAKPTIGQVEYSRDGATWKPLAGESVSGRVSIRVTVSGPVTSARLLVGEREVASGAGNGAFTGNSVALQADGVDVSHPDGAARYAGAALATVEASGRNNDARADDDATTTVAFTVSPTHEGPDEAAAGRWVSGALGWWWRFEDGTYPTSTQLRIDGAIYRFDARGYLDPLTGAMASGWTKVRGTWYHLSSSGAMTTGWLREGSTWYYLADSGAMATGWARVGSTWYHFGDGGAMSTGWLEEGGSWYYLSSSGAMVTGSRWINGTRYVFDDQGRLLQ